MILWIFGIRFKSKKLISQSYFHTQNHPEIEIEGNKFFLPQIKIRFKFSGSLVAEFTLVSEIKK